MKRQDILKDATNELTEYLVSKYDIDIEKKEIHQILDNSLGAILQVAYENDIEQKIF